MCLNRICSNVLSFPCPFPAPPLKIKQQKATQKITKTERKNFEWRDSFWGIFCEGDFLGGGFFPVRLFPDTIDCIRRKNVIVLLTKTGDIIDSYLSSSFLYCLNRTKNNVNVFSKTFSHNF